MSSCILSFTPDDFIYTGSVCTSWKANSPNKRTCTLATLESVSRVHTAIDADMETIELLDVAIVFGADMAVVQKIGEENTCDTSMMPNYAAFTGNMEMVLYLEEPFDEFSIFEAVRGGQVDMVKHMIKKGCELNTIPEWPCIFYNNDTFIGMCLKMAKTAGRSDVVESLTMYTTDKYYQSDIGCVELAIRTNNLEIVKVLHSRRRNG